MFKRPTSLADAFITAAVKQIKAGKVDHVKGTGNWVARHVAVSAEERPTFGLITEYNKRPPAPKKPAKELDSITRSATTAAIVDTVVKLNTGRKAQLLDEEILGVD